MKKLFVLILMVVFAAAVAIAADTVTLKSKMGDVAFNHKAHGEKTKCDICHGTGTPGKLSLGKDAAHKLCQGCHKEQNVPAKCPDCHKKK